MSECAVSDGEIKGKSCGRIDECSIGIGEATGVDKSDYWHSIVNGDIGDVGFHDNNGRRTNCCRVSDIGKDAVVNIIWCLRGISRVEVERVESLVDAGVDSDDHPGAGSIDNIEGDITNIQNSAFGVGNVDAKENIRTGNVGESVG